MWSLFLWRSLWTRELLTSVCTRWVILTRLVRLCRLRTLGRRGVAEFTTVLADSVVAITYDIVPC